MADPPFQITQTVLVLSNEIERLVGRAEGFAAPAPQPMLRKQNRVRTIRGSVAIEGNTLTEEQITAVIDGKRVAGSRREILEVTNANAAYDRAGELRAGRERDLLTAHRLMMTGLVERAGRYRSTNVGVLDGTRVAHMAPPAHQVSALMRTLLGWLRTSTTPALVRSCVAHYELLFIHPFADGNGRIARLWQFVILLEASRVFELVPVESVIRDRQTTYYQVLGRCDRRGDSTEFVEFVLEALRDAVAASLEQLAPLRPTAASRLEAARDHFAAAWFSRGAYVKLHRSISTATASRDLAAGLAEGSLDRRGARRLTEYRFRATARRRP